MLGWVVRKTPQNPVNDFFSFGRSIRQAETLRLCLSSASSRFILFLRQFTYSVASRCLTDSGSIDMQRRLSLK